MSTAIIGHYRFDVECDLMDVTSMARPDPSWKVTDDNGHVHQWYTNGVPASHYSPRLRYDTPTLKWIVDGIGYWKDGEPYEIGHHECRACGQTIQAPRLCPDTTTQFIPGLRHYSINGEPVSEAEFAAKYEQAIQDEDARKAGR
jgi:hypothetical protein